MQGRIPEKNKLNYYLLFILSIFVSNLTVSAQLSDDFSDGDYTSGTVWSGETSKYEVDGSNRLHLNGPVVSDTAYLSTPVGNIDFNQTIVWEFLVEMNFAPSNSNNARVYLVSDQANLRGSLNGYYLRIGESGSTDAIKIYSQSGTSGSLIFTGTANTFGTNPIARVRVTRDGAGNWTVESDATGGTTYVNEGSFTDASITSTAYFGVYSKYTSSNSANIYYDDFSINGTTIIDTTPPDISSLTVVSSTELDVLFNEPVDQTTAETMSNYSVNNGVGTATGASLDGGNPALVHLTFSAFTNGLTNTLTVQNVEDLAGNAMSTSTEDFVYFVPSTPNYRDVVINEIFADPTPQIGLPNAEFIELHNVSSSIFDLSGWQFSDASSTATLGGYILQPGEFVIIADDNYTFDFSIYSNVLFVTTLPSLQNSGDDLFLEDNSNNLIDQVSYLDSWYQDAIKEDGGYTLELINPELDCSDASNWIGSNELINGGTPGLQNSVYDNTPDTDAPYATNATILSNTSVEICFSEFIDTLGLNASQFSISGGITVSTIVPGSTGCLELTVSPALDTGIVYTISINGITDCSGNSTSGDQIEMAVPHLPQAGDLIINEILFNPFTGGDDFVEVYNRSERLIDLFGWKLANWDDGVVDNIKSVEDHRLLYPGDYVVLTKDSTDIKNNYINAVEGSFVQLSTLPTYANDSGTVYLILPGNDTTLSDAFSYLEDYHFALINDPDGVSLERIDFERSSSDPTNWHSAAETEGWATPGYENSQYFPEELSDVELNVSPEIFSPDNDGMDDVVNLSYTTDQAGYVGNITIFDASGRIIRHLMQNELLAESGTISWDGLNNKKEKARIGMYVIYFETFNLNGELKAIKKTCVLAGRLN